MHLPNRMLLREPLPALDDVEGEILPAGLPPVVDAHVHVFPEKLFHAVQAWFDKHGWPIRYSMSSEALLEFLFQRGVSHVVGLQYAHKPGMAEELNDYMIGLCHNFPRLVGLATVYPGEPGAARILAQAFSQGLSGVKLHIHVQGFEMTGAEMDSIYRVCIEHDKPLLMHAGREPKSPAYAHDPYALCDAERVETILKNYPDLRLCVPHLGMDETSTYARLIERYDNLWLDTTMALANYFPGLERPELRTMRLDRILYGSDFPNIPYAWDREIRQIMQLGLNETQLELVLGGNARGLYRILE